MFLEILQNSQENTCARGISKNTFFTEHLWTIPSVTCNKSERNVTGWTLLYILQNNIIGNKKVSKKTK